MNAITYKEIFPLIKENRMWPGANEKGGTRKGNTLLFSVSDDYTGASVITDKTINALHRSAHGGSRTSTLRNAMNH